MADFAAVMQTAVLDRPVVDQTGLTGRYDFTLTWTPDDTQFRSSGPPIVDLKPPTELKSTFDVPPLLDWAAK